MKITAPSAEPKVPSTKRNGVKSTWKSITKSRMFLTEVYTKKEKKQDCVQDVASVKHCITLYFVGFAETKEKYTGKKNVLKMKN